MREKKKKRLQLQAMMFKVRLFSTLFTGLNYLMTISDLKEDMFSPTYTNDNFVFLKRLKMKPDQITEITCWAVSLSALCEGTHTDTHIQTKQ